MSEIDESEAFTAIRELGVRTLIGVVGLIAGIIVVAVLFSRTITNPLIRLTESAGELADGNYHSEIKVSSGDEIGELAGSFETMRLSIASMVDMLEAANLNLEGQVAERTARA